MMEQMYNDFVANVLPKIAEGLTITYEYFMDLFGRYVTYLIVMDSINVALSLFLLLSGIWFTVSTYKKITQKVAGKIEDGAQYGFAVVMSIILVTIITPWLFFSMSNLTKSIIIPEVRVYEELRYNGLIGNNN